MHKTLTYSDLLEFGRDDVIYFPKGTKIKGRAAHRAVHDGSLVYGWNVVDEQGVVQTYLSNADVVKYSPFVEDGEDNPQSQGVEMVFIGENGYSLTVEPHPTLTRCLAASEVGWSCTNPPDHAGPHIAMMGPGELCAIWTTGPDQVQITTYDLPKPKSKQDDGWENATLIDVNGSTLFKGFGDVWYDDAGGKYSKDDLLDKPITILYGGPDTAA